MRKILLVIMMFSLFLSRAAHAQSETQHYGNAGDKVIAEEKKGGYHLISPEELKNEYLKNAAAFLLVDTRQEWSYQMQHIRGAVHMDFAPTWWNQYSPVTRAEMKNILGPDINRKIVFY